MALFSSRDSQKNSQKNLPKNSIQTDLFLLKVEWDQVRCTLRNGNRNSITQDVMGWDDKLE